MDTTRRKFILGASAATGSLLSGLNPFNAAQAKGSVATTAKPSGLKGRYIVLVRMGHYYPGRHASPVGTVSILTSVDIETGAVKQTPLDISHGHSAMGASDGRILCIGQYYGKAMMVDADHKIMANLLRLMAIRMVVTV